MFAIGAANRLFFLLVFGVFLLKSLLANSHSSDRNFPTTLPQPSLAQLAANQNENYVDTQKVNEVPPKTETAPTTVDGRESVSFHQNTRNIPLWKLQLPFPLNNKTNSLRRIVIPGECHQQSYYPTSSCEVEVFLLGTAHVSKDSSRDVRLLLESVKPNVIFLELCHQRLNLLESPSNEDSHTQQEQRQQEKEEDATNESTSSGGIVKRWRGFLRRVKTKNDKRHIDTRSLSSIASSLLTNMQGDFADSLEVELGGEFVAAYEYWKTAVPRGFSSFRRDARRNYVHMILGDRPVSLTLTRGWESLRLWGKFKLMAGLLISSLRKPNPNELREWMDKILNGDSDLMSESVAELAKHFPTLAEVILKERDAYMACKLQQTCEKLLLQDIACDARSQRRHRIVAIVGAGHVEGIFRWLTEGGSLESLTTVPAATVASTTPVACITSQDSTESPADVLSKLVQINAVISKEDHDYLVHELTEINPDFIEETC